MTVTVVDAGPKQVSRSVEVNAPAGEMFAIVADPRRHRVEATLRRLHDRYTRAS